MGPEYEGPVTMRRLADGVYMVRPATPEEIAADATPADDAAPVAGIGQHLEWLATPHAFADAGERPCHLCGMVAGHDIHDVRLRHPHPYTHGLSGSGAPACTTCGLLPGADVHNPALEA